VRQRRLAVSFDLVCDAAIPRQSAQRPEAMTCEVSVNLVRHAKTSQIQ